MNGYKKSLIGLQVAGIAAAGYFVAQPHPKAPRDRMIASLISGVITLGLIWKAK